MRKRIVNATIPLLGRRGAALLLAGTLWLIVGWGVFVMPLPTTRPLAPHEYAPTGVRVMGWCLTGGAAIVSAFLWKQFKGKDGLPVLDRVGFALLMVMPAERVVSWLIVIILHIPGMPHLIPLPPFGIAIAGFSVWLVVCLQQALINGWQEPVALPEVAKLGEM